MKIARILSGKNPTIAISNDAKDWYEIQQLLPQESIGDDITALIADPEKLFSKFDGLLTGKPCSESEFQFLCPFKSPEKIICIGKNYSEHATEMGGAAPSSPVVFSKFNNTLIGPEQSILLPSISDQVDFEAELVVVIGKTCHGIDMEQSLEYVFGYTIGNDVSARDWQKGRPGGQWLLGKTFNSFAPVGPYIVTQDEIGNPSNLKIMLTLNGQTMQSDNTSKMIFDVKYLVAFLSQFMTLNPGDLIFTGTPAGVGAGRTPPLFLQDGDLIEVTIEKIGTLKNDVVMSKSPY